MEATSSFEGIPRELTTYRNLLSFKETTSMFEEWVDSCTFYRIPLKFYQMNI
jgi:hypothetical protein